ncbi:unnamed protein product [Sympodiomycopsis kandeliae]
MLVPCEEFSYPCACMASHLATYLQFWTPNTLQAKLARFKDDNSLSQVLTSNIPHGGVFWPLRTDTSTLESFVLDGSPPLVPMEVLRRAGVEKAGNDVFSTVAAFGDVKDEWDKIDVLHTMMPSLDTVFHFDEYQRQHDVDNLQIVNAQMQ